jgi:hypothetical protein
LRRIAFDMLQQCQQRSHLQTMIVCSQN